MSNEILDLELDLTDVDTSFPTLQENTVLVRVMNAEIVPTKKDNEDGSKKNLLQVPVQAWQQDPARWHHRGSRPQGGRAPGGHRPRRPHHPGWASNHRGGRPQVGEGQGVLTAE